VAVALEVSVAGQKKLARLMSRLDPKRHGEQWQRAALLRAALLVQRVAAQKKIKRGGEGKPLPHVLTSRTGTLRRSIGVDRGPLPGAVDVGTALKYGGVHETGGVFGIPRHTVAAHARRGPFSRGPYSARFPKRPFLVPALEDIVPRLPDIFVEEIQKVLRAGA
jgi:phage gpG-like protein